VSSVKNVSGTAFVVAEFRADENRQPTPLYEDPVVALFLDKDSREAADRMAASFPPVKAMVKIRTKYLDDVLDSQLRDGFRQVVVLGAGLDARAWRMPELAHATVFEVDHPASQRDKRRRLDDLEPTAGQVVGVAVDLEHDALAPALEACGFDPTLETTWVWEGVVPYLTSDAVAETVRALAEVSARGSILVVNYQSRSVSATMVRRVLRVVMRLSRQHDPLAGEPWRSTWSSATMRAMLAYNGFETATDDDLLALASDLGLPPLANASLRNGRVAVAVRR